MSLKSSVTCPISCHSCPRTANSWQAPCPKLTDNWGTCPNFWPLVLRFENARPLRKVLQALPSAACFSLEMLKQIWNQFRGNGGFLISSYDDVWSTAEGILGRLRFRHCSPPVLTEFKVSYNCPNCGLSESVPPRLFSTVPILNIPNQSTPISIFELFSTFISQPVHISCNCCQQNVTAYLDMVPGRLTALFINRMEFSNQAQQPLINTRLSLGNNARQTSLGQLICCVSHIQTSGGGHWVTYSQAEGNWWLNNDCRIASRSSYHPFVSPNSAETCVFVVFEKT